MQSFVTGIEADGGRLTVGTLFGDAAERLNARNVEEERDVAPREGRHRVLAITALNRLLWREKTQIEAFGLTINREGSRITLERSPIETGVITLELRIDQMVVLLSRHRVVIIFLPNAELLSA